MEFNDEMSRLHSVFSFPPATHIKENNFSSLTIEQKRPPEEEFQTKSRSHLASKAPYCLECSKKSNMFNMKCDKCYQNIFLKKTNISQLFAICRQWTPDIQSNMDIFVEQILKRNAHPDDWDDVTGMSIIHYVCKSGSESMGNSDKSLQTLIHLVEDLGANLYSVCDINQMTALHYSVFYDAHKLVGYLISQIRLTSFSKISSPINQVCGYHSRTSLHLAASNLCLRSARILLGANANILIKDELGLTALDCIPEDDIIIAKYGFDCKQLLENALELRSLLEEETFNQTDETNSMILTNTVQIHLLALNLEIGSRITINDQKNGILRFCGHTKFSSGIWAGIELDTPTGKNDGAVDGYRYFSCQPNHGLFTLLEKIKLADEDECYYNENDNENNRYNFSILDFNNVKPKVDTGNRKSICQISRILSGSSISSNIINNETIVVGNRVYLRDKKVGLVRFVGPTEFADGIWYGIELSRPEGKNNGSVNGIQYFTCPDKYGLFVTNQKIVRIMPTKTHNSNLTSVTTLESDGTTSDLSIALSATSSMDVLPHFANQRQSTSMSQISLNPQVKRRLSMNIQRTASLRRSMSNFKKSLFSEKEKRLKLGMTAFVNGQFGIVRFIGPVHFSDELYLGIELKFPNGKNDGSIEDKRYFSCKQNHGLFVRPQKVTIHGISAAQMLAQDEEDAKAGH